MCPLYGISLFLPTIVRSLGYSSSQAQLMTVPIYITAAIIAVIVAYTSDRVGKRSPFIITLLCIMVIGFTMCISSSNPRVVYGGVFLATCAIYPAFPGVITWLANNLAGSYKRSVGMAIQIGVGNLGGVSNLAVVPLNVPKLTNHALGYGIQLLPPQGLAPVYSRTRARAWLHRRGYHCRPHACLQLHQDQQGSCSQTR